MSKKVIDSNSLDVNTEREYLRKLLPDSAVLDLVEEKGTFEKWSYGIHEDLFYYGYGETHTIAKYDTSSQPSTIISSFKRGYFRYDGVIDTNNITSTGDLIIMKDDSPNELVIISEAPFTIKFSDSNGFLCGVAF